MIWGLRVAQGLAFGLAFPVAGALVADLAPAAARVRALGLFGIVTQLTQAGAPALAEALAVGLGYPTVFGFAAGAAAVASVLTWPLGRRMVRHDTQTSVDSNHGPRPKESTLQQQLALATIVVGTGVTYGAVVTFAPVLLLKLGATSVGPFFAAVSLASVAVRALFGGLGDRVNQDSLISWSGLGATLAVVGAAMLAAAAPSAHAVPLGVLLGIAFGCSAGMFYPVANVRYLELGTARDRGRRMAYYAATYAAGITAGNLVLGFAAERWGFAVMYAVVAALHAAAGLWFWTATRS
jgi:MFS family permease